MIHKMIERQLFMTTYDYDVIYIGSGHAANHGALKLVKQGKKVAFVEGDKLGGTCTNYGCDAKLLLDGAFQVLEDVQNFQAAGLKGTPVLEWDKLMAYKHQVIDAFPKLMGQIIPKAGIKIYPGYGSFVDSHTIRVNDETITAENIIIATGQRDSTLPIPGNEFIHNSKDFLDLEQLPDAMIFIGAGLISMEFASMMIKAGVDVIIVDIAEHPLTNFYDKYVDKVVDKLQKEGVTFYFNETIKLIEQQNQTYLVTTNSGRTLQADYIFGGTGRIANVEDLGLEELGIKTSARGIVVDDHLRTAQPNIFASGDVIDKRIPKLTPTATYESNYIAKVLLGDESPISYPTVPYTVYTLPRISEIGLSISDAQKNSDRYDIKQVPYGRSYDTKRNMDAELTLVYEKATQHVKGASIYGNDAPGLINILTFIIDKELTTTDLEQIIFGFPDVSYNLLGRI